MLPSTSESQDWAGAGEGLEVVNFLFILYLLVVVGLGVSCTASARFSYYRSRLSSMGLVLSGSG